MPQLAKDTRTPPLPCAAQAPALQQHAMGACKGGVAVVQPPQCGALKYAPAHQWQQEGPDTPSTSGASSPTCGAAGRLGPRSAPLPREAAAAARPRAPLHHAATRGPGPEPPWKPTLNMDAATYAVSGLAQAFLVLHSGGAGPATVLLLLFSTLAIITRWPMQYARNRCAAACAAALVPHTHSAAAACTHCGMHACAACRAAPAMHAATAC